ncbi:MAG: Hpt domain-containing protein [Treponema sp.]|jgi:HPt (histidine-containing phosphotransfer) domain-containing protein|nr:Hpt domain-containing protein [Treponema sp.]
MTDILEQKTGRDRNTGVISQEYMFSAFIREIIAIMKFKTAESGIHFTVNIDCNIPDKLSADLAGMRDILTGIFGYIIRRAALAAEHQANTVYAGQGYITFCADLEDFNSTDVKIKMEISESLSGEIFTLLLTQNVLADKRTAVVENPEKNNILVYEQRVIYANSIIRTLDSLGVNYKLVSGVSAFYNCLESNDYSYVFLPQALYEDVRIRYSYLTPFVKFAVFTDTDEEVLKGNVSAIAMPVHCITIANLLNGVSGGEGGRNEKFNIKGLDAEKGIVMADNNMQNYIKVLSLFQKDALEKISGLKAFMETDNIRSYTINAHSLKSACAIIGADSLSETSKLLENAGIRNDMAFIREHTAAFIAELETLISKINLALEEEPEKDGNSAINAEVLINELSCLKNALNAFDFPQINNASDSLQKYAFGKISAAQSANKPLNLGESVRAILENKLKGNYDEAVSIIDALTLELKKERRNGQ